MASCSKESGVAHVVVDYYRHLHEDVVFDFLLYWDVAQSYKEEIESLGGRIIVTGKPGIRSAVSYLKQVDHFFKEHAKEYDAVHLHEVYLSGIIFPIAKRYGLRVLISHSHTTEFSDKRMNAIRNAVLFYPARMLSTHFFACSLDAGVAAFGTKIAHGKNFYLQRNAIDIEKFLYSDNNRQKIREEFGLENSLVVGHIGRFAPQKNHMFLLDVFAKVVEREPNAKLLLVGNGPLFDDARKKAEELGIGDSVIQTGVRKDVGALLAAMDVFVLPSLFEGLGIVLIEAQCSGLPCVAATSITEEARVLPDYYASSLNDSPETWADVILNCNMTRNLDALTYIEKAGYELTTAAKDLVNQYKIICNKN